MPAWAKWLILAVVLAQPGCAYNIGKRLADGVYDSSGGKSKSSGLDGLTSPLVKDAIVEELGRQLGHGLSSGIGEVTPEQRASLEATVDGILATAASRTGKGLREDVSPELREMIRKDVVGAFADGLRGELGDSMEETIERVVNRAILALERGINDPDLHEGLAETLRYSVYSAMRQGRPGSVSISETLETTVSENVLDPFEQSVSTLTSDIALQVNESAKRTENILKTVVAALVVILGAFAVMYFITRRQLQRARDSSVRAQQGLRSVGAAIEVLDEEARENLINNLEKYQAVAGQTGDIHGSGSGSTAATEARSDDYLRDD